LREGLGLSQAQLAGQAEISQGYLSQIENDEVNNPSAAVLFRLAKTLHVDPRVLLEAAGYKDLLGLPPIDGDSEYVIDPDLLRFLSRLTLEEQKGALTFLEVMERTGQTT
jgi:transcriptional regulator with XRE-family HTH domain